MISSDFADAIFPHLRMGKETNKFYAVHSEFTSKFLIHPNPKIRASHKTDIKSNKLNWLGGKK